MLLPILQGSNSHIIESDTAAILCFNTFKPGFSYPQKIGGRFGGLLKAYSSYLFDIIFFD